MSRSRRPAPSRRRRRARHRRRRRGRRRRGRGRVDDDLRLRRRRQLLHDRPGQPGVRREADGDDRDRRHGHVGLHGQRAVTHNVADGDAVDDPRFWKSRLRSSRGHLLAHVRLARHLPLHLPGARRSMEGTVIVEGAPVEPRRRRRRRRPRRPPRRRRRRRRRSRRHRDAATTTPSRPPRATPASRTPPRRASRARA